MSVMADILSANNEKRRNLIYNVLNGNKHGAANGYDKEHFADHRSLYSFSADGISAGTDKMERVRSHLLPNNIVNKESFDDYMSELV